MRSQPEPAMHSVAVDSPDANVFEKFHAVKRLGEVAFSRLFSSFSCEWERYPKIYTCGRDLSKGGK